MCCVLTRQRGEGTSCADDFSSVMCTHRTPVPHPPLPHRRTLPQPYHSNRISTCRRQGAGPVAPQGGALPREYSRSMTGPRRLGDGSYTAPQAAPPSQTQACGLQHDQPSGWLACTLRQAPQAILRHSCRSHLLLMQAQWKCGNAHQAGPETPAKQQGPSEVAEYARSWASCEVICLCIAQRSQSQLGSTGFRAAFREDALQPPPAMRPAEPEAAVLVSRSNTMASQPSLPPVRYGTQRCRHLRSATQHQL